MYCYPEYPDRHAANPISAPPVCQFESMLDEEMKKKKDSYRKAQMSAGACSACAAFCGCNRLQGEGLLTPIEEDKRVGGDKGKQVLHAGKL